MTDIEKLLAAIEAGLKGVTPGPWKWAFKKLAEVPVGTLYGKGGDDVVCDFGDAAEYYPTEGTLPSETDQAHIARLSPDNVRAILDYIRQIKRERDEARAALSKRVIVTVERVAEAEAQFDGRDWAGMPRRDRERYTARAATALATIECERWRSAIRALATKDTAP